MTKREPYDAVLSPPAAVWLTLALIETALSAFIPGTALRDAQMPFVTRFSLLAFDLLLLAAIVGTTYGVVMLIVTLAGHHRAVRRAAIGAGWLLAWSAVLLYVTSWALFWNTGVFLDSQAFTFLAPNPLQVFHWVYPPLALGVLAITMIVTFVLLRWIPRRAARLEPRARRRLVVSAVTAASACMVAALSGHASAPGAPPSHGHSQVKSQYVIDRDTRTAPLVHAVLDWRRTRTAPAEAPAQIAANGARIVHRRIVTLERYLTGITPGDAKRWNVVMVQVESLRSDQLRVYGGVRDVMPTIDSLGLEARVFTNAYVQASHSNYADLVALSSHYPLRSPDMYVYPKNPTYPRVLIYDILKALGYKTAIFSSQNERWGGMINYHRPASLDRFFHAETFDGPTYAPFGDVGFAEWVKRTGSAGSVDDRYTVGEAIKWIDTVLAFPFFIHMNLQSSHVPYVVPDDFPHRFGPKTIDFPIMWGRFPLDKVDVVKDRYADSLFYADTQIARLFEYLKTRGLWGRTIVIIGGDNGEAFYEHGIAAHASTLFNEVIKVPMVIKAPQVQPSLDDRPAMFLDVPPTILDLLGLPPHPAFQGISLFDDHPNPRRSIFAIVQTPLAFQSAIIRSGFKLLYSEWEKRYFLWDLVKDAAERVNIADSRPDLVQEMAGQLQVWRNEQLSYYADVARQGIEYPPVVLD